MNNPTVYWDPNGLFSIGFGLVLSWDPDHGFGIGVGIAFSLSKEFGVELYGGYNFGDQSYSFNAGVNVNLNLFNYVSVKVGLGYGYNSEDGHKFNASLGASIVNFGAEIGTEQTWYADGSYRGGLSYAKAFIGSTQMHVGGGYQIGTGVYSGDTGWFMEGKVGGLSAKFQENGKMTFGAFGVNAQVYQGQFALTGFRTEVGYRYDSGSGQGGLYSSTWNSVMETYETLVSAYKYLTRDAVAKKMTEERVRPKLRKDYEQEAWRKTLAEAYYRDYMTAMWQSHTEQERQTYMADRRLQKEYASRMSGENIVTYRIDGTTGKVYRVLKDNSVVQSEDGQDQYIHYRYKVGQNGADLDALLLKDGSYVIIGEEGYGGNMRVGGNDKTPGNMRRDLLNDRITIIMNQGGDIIIKEFNNSSVDPTNYLIGSNQQVVKYDGSVHYATLAQGSYGIQTFIRLKDGVERNLTHYASYKYLAFRTTDYTPTVGENPADPSRGNPGYAVGILIHANTTQSWNTSQGCQVILESDYREMVDMFRTTYFDAAGAQKHGYSINASGMYYLYR